MFACEEGWRSELQTRACASASSYISSEDVIDPGGSAPVSRTPALSVGGPSPSGRCSVISSPQMVITQDETARSPSVAAPDARFLKTRSKRAPWGPPPTQICLAVRARARRHACCGRYQSLFHSRASKGAKQKRTNLTGHFWGRSAVRLALPGLGAERGGGWGGSSTLTDVGLNNQLRVFPNKNFRKSAVVGCLVGRCTKGKVPGWGPGCIATPSTANYPSTPLIAVLTISHSSGSLPLVPVYQRFLLNASSILKHRLRA